MVLYLILYVLAATCFLAYALDLFEHPRVNLLGLGVFFWSLVPLFKTLQYFT